jgi:Immunoglobulin domain/Immunoglobulin I-set domain
MNMSLKSSWIGRPGHSVCLACWLGLGAAFPAAPPTSVPIMPQTLEAPPGATADFFVNPNGDPPLHYQWQKNGVNLPGQTNVSLTLSNVAVADGGGYRAVAFNEAGALYSEEALLTLTASVLPADDRFGSGTAINAVTNTVRGSNVTATREPGEPMHFNRPGSNSVWYTWTAPASGLATFDTRGSAFDTLLAVYSGDDFQHLSELASDDDGGDFHASLVRWNAEAGRDYHVAIDGLAGQSGDYVCTWHLEITPDRAPVITLRPQSQTVPEGGTAWFRAAVEAEPGLNLQWLRNGQPVPGATASNLVINNVQSADLGNYVLSVTNAGGFGAATPPAALEIGPVPDVYSRDKLGELPTAGGSGGAALRGALGGSFSLAAGTIINQRFFNDGTSDRCEPAHCQQPGGASRWFQLRADADGICTLDTEGSDVDTVLAVYMQNFGICTQLFEPLVGCNNDVVGDCARLLGPTNEWDRSSRFSFFASAGTVYRAVVDTALGVRGTNLYFNVQFQAAASSPPLTIFLDETNRHLLVRRGDALVLGVTPELRAPKSGYQWRSNSRDVAGANQETLLLPQLNFSDAARYSVTIRNGTETNTLPGVLIAVTDLCPGALGSGPAGSEPSVSLFGAVAEPTFLWRTSALDPDLPWTALGTFPASKAPYLWSVSREPAGFFQVAEPPP